jgi:hypothetical protein
MSIATDALKDQAAPQYSISVTLSESTYHKYFLLEKNRDTPGMLGRMYEEAR